MAITLNSNIASMRTIRALGAATNQLTRGYERLSSGLRIVHPADDAAGLAIGSSLALDTRVYSRARMNINDASSALQIVDGAAGEISNMLSRMSELAEQAANGAISFAQRKRLDDEYQALNLEIRRIASTTSFNGRNLMSGQTSNRGNVFLATAGTISALGANGDGSKVYYYDGEARTINLYDTATGTTRSFGSSVEAFTSSIDSIGNIVYKEGQELYRYNVNSNQSERIVSNVNGGVSGLTISADGRKIAYTEFNGSSYSLYLLDIDSRARTTIATGMSSAPIQSSLSPDGTKLGFESVANLTGQNGSGLIQFFSVDLSGATPRLTQASRFSSNAGTISGPRITNQGDIYFLGNATANGTAANGTASINRIAADGTFSAVLTVSAATFAYTAPTLGADGKTLSFVSNAQLSNESTNGMLQAFRFDIESNTATQLTRCSNYELDDLGNGLFSGDGNMLIFEDASGTAVYTKNVTREDDAMSMEVGQGNRGGISTTLAAINGTLKGLGGMTLTSATAAAAALVRTRDNIQLLAGARGVYGASQSRLDVANSVLASQVLNGESARSQIMDADIAQESALLVRGQILQRAASALLAQANQQPALALQLLGR